ncbi:MAG: hypothetical protein COB01_06440 [Lutibacter sp.]|nr:MAG: hypothetical protein COB01_06440 [Lutibacter sp.]
MQYLLRRILLIVVVCSGLIACEKEEKLSNNNLLEQDVQVNYSSIELKLLSLVNDHRIQLGLTKLNSLGLISKEAENHSAYMAEKDLVSHDNFNIRTNNLYENLGTVNVGENVAYGYLTANGLLNAWLASSDHRIIIENKNFTDFGVSAKLNASGRYYFTMIFIKRL